MSDVEHDDLGLWHRWKQSQSPEDLSKLLKAFDGTIHGFIGKYQTWGVPYPALEAHAKRQAVQAFKTFDPSLGFKLNTHVTNMMKNTRRFVDEHKGLTRIPDHRSMKVHTFTTVRDNLKEKLGRDPNLDELHEELSADHSLNEDPNHGWSKPEIMRMEKELHRTLLTSEDMLQGEGVQESSKDQALIDYVYYELNPQEKVVYEYLTGRHGKPLLDGAGVAKQLKMTPSTVSRIRQRIADKFAQHRDSFAG